MAASGTQKLILVGLGLFTLFAGLGSLVFVSASRSRTLNQKRAESIERSRAARMRRVALTSTSPAREASIPGLVMTRLEDRESPEGGLDLAASEYELGEVLARRIHAEIKRRHVHSSTTIVLVAKGHEDGRTRGRLFDYAKHIADRLQQRGLAATAAMTGVGGYSAGTGLMALPIAIEEREGLDVVTVGREFGGIIAAASLNPSVAQRSGHRWDDREWWSPMPIRFASVPTTDIQAARGDALESLGKRIRNYIFDAAVERDFLSADADERAAFAKSLSRRFDDTVIAGFGDLRMFHSAWELDDTTYHHAIVSWKPDADAIHHAAYLVSQDHVVRQRGPWIRGGLILAALILAVLGWLRVDWLMQGRFGVLTKLMFLVLLAASCVLIYNVELFHG